MGRQYGLFLENFALVDHQGVLRYRSDYRARTEAIRSAIEDALDELRNEEDVYFVDRVVLSQDAAVSGGGEVITAKASIARSSRAEDSRRIERVSVRFFGRGEAGEWVLLDDATGGDEVGGDGLFTGRFQVPEDLPSGRYRLRVQVEDDRGHLVYRDVSFDILPVADLLVMGDALAEGWQVEDLYGVENLDLGEGSVVFAGGRASVFQVEGGFPGWAMAFRPADPVGGEGWYETLRFALHPGAGVASHQGLFKVSVTPRQGKAVNLLREEWMHMDREEWQVVEIPLDVFKIEGPIESIDFFGTFGGTFYLDELRLVVSAGSQSSAPAVPEEHVFVLPQRFSLEQNFPNPFNGATTIRFALPASTEVDLSVYNLMGQKVATLAQGAREAGIHAVSWDGRDRSGRNLASGVYLYRLRAGEDSRIRRLMLLQ